MERKLEDDWNEHSDYYSEYDISMFNELLPNLLSGPAKKTSWAKKEHKQMMQRFKKSFGDSPLKIKEK